MCGSDLGENRHLEGWPEVALSDGLDRRWLRGGLEFGVWGLSGNASSHQKVDQKCLWLRRLIVSQVSGGAEGTSRPELSSPKGQSERTLFRHLEGWPEVALSDVLDRRWLFRGWGLEFGV